MAKVNWEEALKPMLKKYKGKQHPLELQKHLSVAL